MGTMSSGQGGISRRTVVKGTAWGVPAILVASAVPAMAASGLVTVSPVARGCTARDWYFESGSWFRSYRAYPCFTNGTGRSVELAVPSGSISVSPLPSGWSLQSRTGAGFQLGAGETVCTRYLSFTLRVPASVAGGAGQGPTDSFDSAVLAFDFTVDGGVATPATIQVSGLEGPC